MATETTGTFTHGLWPGIKAWYGLAYAEFPKQYAQIFEVMKSNQNFERDVGFYGLGLPKVKPEGQSIQFDDLGQGYKKDYTHLVYANGYIMTREAIEDNLYPKIAQAKTRALAKSINQGMEIVAANVFNNGFTTETSSDGAAIFSTSHNLYKGGTEANKLTTDLPLSEAALEAMVLDLRKHLDESGLRANVQPKKLLIPSDLEFEADRIINSKLRAYTADNDKNVASGMFPGGVLINNYLTNNGGASPYFILTDCDNGFKMYMRRAVELVNDTPDFETEIMKVKSSVRFSVGCTDYRQGYGSDGS